TGFDLHYTISPSSSYSLLATLPANTTSYPHTGLSHTTTYCYKVAATNSVGMSAFSNTACATTPVPSVTTGVMQHVSEKQLLCYPNPASTAVYFDVLGSEKIIEVNIYNALGSLVMT